VLVSFFPVYLFTKNVAAGTDVAVELMLPANKGCPHGYDLTPGDAKKIAAADIYVMNGGGLEEFDEAKIKKFNGKISIIDSTKGMTLLESTCCEDEEQHEHQHHHDSGKNPHSFSSPKYAAQQVRAIAAGLAAADPGRAAAYKKNADAYATKLEAIGKRFETKLAGLPNRKVVAMHEIFEYLAKDAGLDVVGEIVTGAGTEASPPKKLIAKMKKDAPKAILTEPQYDEKMAKALSRETGVPYFKIDPLATGPDAPALDHYEKTMESNLAALVAALGGKS
jgi:ABC-type Zn uptake system ZnuABC Zn-binding protein ZnuA